MTTTNAYTTPVILPAQKQVKSIMASTILVSVILGLSADISAQEQAIKIFGELDIAVMHSKGSTSASLRSLETGLYQQSHFGLEVQEKLSSDFQLQARLDSFVNLDTGSTVPNAIWSRESSISLKNQNWRLSLGKNLSPIFDHAVSFNSFNNARLAPLFSIVAFATTHPLNPAQDNSIRIDWRADEKYAASYLYRVSETANSMYWTAAFAYHQQQTSLGLAIDHSAPLGGQGSLYSVLASASHQTEYLKLFANLLAQKDTNLQQRSWGGELGLIAPITGGNLKLAYAKGSKSALNNGKLNQLSSAAIAYEYLFSKRSSAYCLAQLQQRVNASNSHALALGLTHRF